MNNNYTNTQIRKNNPIKILELESTVTEIKNLPGAQKWNEVSERKRVMMKAMSIHTQEVLKLRLVNPK